MYEPQVRWGAKDWSMTGPPGSSWHPVDSREPFAAIDGLPAGQYEFRMVAIAEVQAGNRAILIRSAASPPTEDFLSIVRDNLPPPPPVLKHPEAMDQSTLQITWEPPFLEPPVEVVGYELQLLRDGSFCTSRLADAWDRKLEFTVVQMTVGAEY
eukprot:3775610-Prymnesium_polylepis.1